MRMFDPAAIGLEIEQAIVLLYSTQSYREQGNALHG